MLRCPPFKEDLNPMSKPDLSSHRLARSPLESSRLERSPGGATIRHARSKSSASIKRGSSIGTGRSTAVSRAIEEARRSHLAVIRPSIVFAFSCLTGAELARNRAAARIALQHARGGYELARRVFSNDCLAAAGQESLGDELTALRLALEKAEAQHAIVRVDKLTEPSN